MPSSTQDVSIYLYFISADGGDAPYDQELLLPGSTTIPQLLIKISAAVRWPASLTRLWKIVAYISFYNILILDMSINQRTGYFVETTVC
jgi:hypothetical protein